jgi:hypothetical protein
MLTIEVVAVTRRVLTKSAAKHVESVRNIEAVITDLHSRALSAVGCELVRVWRRFP